MSVQHRIGRKVSAGEAAPALDGAPAAGDNQAVPRLRREVADTEFNLGWLLAEMERSDDAIDLFNSALERRLRLLGPNHREVGATRAGLAGAYAERGNVLAAAQEARQAGEILLAQEGTGQLAEAALHRNAVLGRSRATKAAALRPVRLVAAGERTAETNFVAQSAAGAVAWGSSFPDPLAPPPPTEGNEPVANDPAGNRSGPGHPAVCVPSRPRPSTCSSRPSPPSTSAATTPRPRNSCWTARPWCGPSSATGTCTWPSRCPCSRTCRKIAATSPRRKRTTATAWRSSAFRSD